ncbi:MAG: 2-oxoglutarate and iron-dependent oxygenase domain-containing protein [Dehalococcoidia bacterium]|nr:2-oxoglutarate and iron-dependent oxygenase domain-containing protein [Dehalococcoidia bacterium]
MTTMFKAVEEIDLSPLFRTTDHQPSIVDAQITHALVSDGAFVATGFTDSSCLDERVSNLMRFFDLPLELKMQCATKSYQPSNPNLYRGYYPLPETPDWAYKESFDIGPEPAMTSPDVPGAVSFREPNVWPSEADLPKWRSEMQEQLQQLRTLGTLLMAAIARGLNLDPEPFLMASHGRNATMRLLSRPILTKKLRPAVMTDGDNGEKISPKYLESIEDGRWIITSRHVDENLLSILWQSSAGGLQMEGSDGTWREVYPRDGTLSIHCGTLLTHLSGNQLVGTAHRVVSDGTSRTSLGHFLEPEFETNIFTSGSLSPVSYAQHLVDLFPGRFTAPDAAY